MIQALTSYQLASNDIMAAGGWYNTYNNGAVLELLGGYEWQHMTYRDTYLFGGLPEKDDGRNHMVFGRIDFGWPALRLGGKNSPWIANAGISTRLGHLYSNIHIEDYRNEKETTTTDYTANGLMLEPQLQLGIGWKMIQLNLRAGLSMRFNLDDAPFNYMPYTLGLGIQVRL